MRAIACCWLVVMAGCGNPPAPGSEDIAAFRHAEQTARCDFSIRCGRIGASEGSDYCGLGTNLNSPVDWVALVGAGQIAFDSGRAADCLASIRSSSCAGLLDALESEGCRRAIRGQAQLGQPCITQHQCAAGTCSQAADGCPGTCITYVNLDDPCGAPPAVCDPATSSCDLTRSRCVALGGAGASCGTSIDCAAGLRCLVNRSCGTTAGPDEPCGATKACDDALYCDGQPSTCMPRLGAGGSCTVPATHGGASTCQDGLTCAGPKGGMPGRCAPWLDAGAACLASDVEATGCPLDMLCDPVRKVCVIQGAPPGTDCTSSADCHLGTCDPADRCSLPLELGAPCTPPVQGQIDVCAGGRCDPATKTCQLMCT